MQGIHIVATAKALPKAVVSNDDLSKIVDTSDEWIRPRTGISTRYKCQEENCSILAINSAREAVRKAGIDISDIGIVVVATSSSEYVFPSTACMVQKALGLDVNTMAFDISAACSGFIYGLEVCRSLLMTSKKRYALLVGSEQMSRLLDYTDRSTCVLFGDGAAATLLELDESLYVHKAWSDGNDNILYCKGVGYENSVIHMEGNEVFKFAVRVIKEGIDSLLDEAGMGMDDISYVVCHQANERIINYVAKKYKGYEVKFFKNISRYANTSAASVPIALEDMFSEGILENGMKIILVGFGAGFTWSSALITI